MANTKENKKVKRPSAAKRVLQSQKKQLINKSFKSKMRTAIASLRKAHTKNEAPEAIQGKLNTVYSLVDLAVKKGIYKTGKAGNIKSRLTLTK